MKRRQVVLAGSAALAGLMTSQVVPRRLLAAEALPKVPRGRDPGGLKVGFIGAGINYTLPAIAQRLARDGEGEIIGFDFETGDLRPFERPAGAGGTLFASVILGEAGASTLIAVRPYPGQPTTLAAAIAMLMQTPARIAALDAAGTNIAEFAPFKEASSKARDLLIIVAAGSGETGADIDVTPSYPAAFGLPNVLVVTGTDPNGRLLEDSSWGRASVDVALPAVDLEATDFTGADARVSGQRYAVARATAMAARLKAVHPNLVGAGLKAKILEFATPNPATPAPVTKTGWIANPKRIAWLE